MPDLSVSWTESDSTWCWTSKSIMRRSILSFHRDRVNCSNSTSAKDGWALRQEKDSMSTMYRRLARVGVPRETRPEVSGKVKALFGWQVLKCEGTRREPRFKQK